MALGLGVQLAFNDYVLHVCKALRSCNESQELAAILQGLLTLVTIAQELCTDHGKTEPSTTVSTTLLPLAKAYERLQHELRAELDAKQSIQRGMRQHLEVIASSLFPGKLCLGHNLQYLDDSICGLLHMTILAVLTRDARASSQANIEQAEQLFLQAPATAVLQALST